MTPLAASAAGAALRVTLDEYAYRLKGRGDAELSQSTAEVVALSATEGAAANSDLISPERLPCLGASQPVGRAGGWTEALVVTASIRRRPPAEVAPDFSYREHIVQRLSGVSSAVFARA